MELLEAIEMLLRAGFGFADALWIVLTAEHPVEQARYLAVTRIGQEANDRYSDVLDRLAEL